MKFFCDHYNLKNIKHVKRILPPYIDVILTNYAYPFQSRCVLNTELFDVNLSTLTVMRRKLEKLQQRLTNYRSCKKF